MRNTANSCNRPHSSTTQSSDSGFWVILLMGFLAVSPLQRKPWKIHINPFATPRNFLGILQVAEFCLGGHLWDFFMGFLWDLCGILRDFNGIFMEFVPGWPQKLDFYKIFLGFSWDCCGSFMGLLWEFEDLMRILSRICKHFPGIYWEFSGNYSSTRVFYGNNVGFPWGPPN